MKICKHCGKPIPYDKLMRSRYAQYCSRDCKNIAQTKYSDETRQYVTEHIGQMHLRTLAQKLNVTCDGLRRQISVWRSEGYNVGGARYEHYSGK